MVHMDESNVNKLFFRWSDRYAGRGCKNHNFHVKGNFRKLGLKTLSDVRGFFSHNTLISHATEAQTIDFVADCYNTINSESGRSGKVTYLQAF